jgi:hypothetical protein
MDLYTYEMLFQFNHRLDEALASLDIPEKSGLESSECVSKIRANLSELRAYANDHFPYRIAKREQEQQNNFYCVRRNREKAEEGSDEIYFELKAGEESRREQGLPPRAAILPWSQADDDRILAMRKAAFSSLPIQPEQPRVTGDSEHKRQRGGTPT